MYAVQSILCFLITFLSICLLVDHQKQELQVEYIFYQRFRKPANFWELGKAVFL